MLSKLTSKTSIGLAATSAVFGSAMANDGGCRMAIPSLPTSDCSCSANPTVSNFAACRGETPLYFNDLNDLPNGACVMYANHKKESTSVANCSADSDCLPGLGCSGGMCADSTGVREVDRNVMACVSPKTSDSQTPWSGCGFSDGDNILNCHKYWISDTGMEWKRYIQHNPMGKGEMYAWAYDEAVCSVGGNQRVPGNSYPWCQNQHGQSAVDGDGNVIDSSCPCTVNNNIAPLSAIPFKENGWGKHMYVHIYDLMYPGYEKPTGPNQFTPLDIATVPAENDEFYMKVVNQYKDDIIVYMDAPPARKNEHVTGKGDEVNGAKWYGWNGPTKTMRGSTEYNTDVSDGDAWVPRITIAPNSNPSAVTQPAMRVSGEGHKLGGFYVPKDHHLRINIADKSAGGWFQTNNGCRETACWGPGVSLWFTRADGYSYANRDPLLLVEPNVNAFTDSFENGMIWFDLSGVDGVNANLQLLYGKIDRMVSIPLFEKQQGIESEENSENVEKSSEFLQ